MIRSTLYRAARYLGDVRAVSKGRLPQRIARKFIFRHAFRVAGWVTRMLGVGR